MEVGVRALEAQLANNEHWRTKVDLTRIQISSCNISTKVAEWKCTCRKYWHNCDAHMHCTPVRNASDQSKAKRERISEDKEDAARSKKVPKLDYSIPIEQMLEQETRRAKRTRLEEDEWLNEPTIDLGILRIKSIRVASLGPNLRKKFVHPGGL